MYMRVWCPPAKTDKHYSDLISLVSSCDLKIFSARTLKNTQGFRLSNTISNVQLYLQKIETKDKCPTNQNEMHTQQIDNT